jgi:predicted nucleic acid-binding protein
LTLLLDTNVYSAIGRGHPKVVELVRGAEALLISAVAVGELLGGFRRGSRCNENLADLRRFLDQPRTRLVPVAWTTADRYGRIYTALREKGTPIPTNDMWIAAHALETGADLVSFDPHFRHVDGLAWINPDHR